MASEPNKKMAELLKAYAQQRREEAGAPFALHPATRRLLLAETARRTKPPQPIEVSGLQRWRHFLPRLAFATLMAVLMAGLVWILIPGTSQKMQLAQTAPSPAQPPVPSAAPTRNRQAPLEAVTDRDVSSTKKKETLAAQHETLSLASKAPAPASAPAPSQPEVQVQPDSPSAQGQLYAVQDAARSAISPDLKNEAERTPATRADASSQPHLTGGKAAQLREEAKVPLETRVNAPALALATPAAPAPAPISGLAGSFGGAVDSTQPRSRGAAAEISAPEQVLTTPRRRFQQATPAPATAGRVLNVFELEHTGSQVRIIDADGSVYAGELVTGLEAARIGRRFLPAEPQPSRRLTGPLLKQQPILEKARGGAASRATAEYAAFRATGTNRTLNLPVVIEAVFIPLGSNGAAPSSSPAPTASFAQPSRPAGLKPAEQTPFPSAAATTTIQGTARIGRTNQMTLNARPVER